MWLLRKYRVFVGVLVFAVIPALLPFASPFTVPSALAADVTIDDFNAGEKLTVFPDGIGDTESGSRVDDVAGALGGERDTYIEATAGTGWYTGNAAWVEPVGGWLESHRQFGVNDSVEMQWDGDDGDATTLDADGLGGVDLTGGGTNDRLFIDITANNLGVYNILFYVYTDGANVSKVTIDIEGVPNDVATYSIPFSSFSVASGTGVDFTNVGAITLSYSSIYSGSGPHINHFWAGVTDTTPPVTTATVEGTQSAGWYTTSPRVTLEAADVSGVASIYYKLDSGDYQLYSDPFSITADGQHTLMYYATDTKGNEETPKSKTIKVDRSAPVVTPTVTGTRIGTSVWYIDQPTVALTATDSNGSGVADIYYKVDNGLTQTYIAESTFLLQGTHQISYWAVDNVGNQGTVRELTLNVDTVAPTASASVSPAPAPSGWYLSDASVTLSATDATSGGTLIFYRINGGIFLQYTGPIPRNSDGDYTIEYFSQDAAGNSGSMQSVDLKIDSTAPSGSIDFNPDSNANGWWNALPIAYTTTCTDTSPGSGVVDASMSGQVTDSATTSVTQTCTDKAGNETPVSDSLQIDTLQPIVNVSSPSFFNEGDSIVLDASGSFDAQSPSMSGIDTIRWDLDNDGEYESPDKTTITRPDNTAFTVGIQVTDKAGNVATTTRYITVLNAPPSIDRVVIDNQQVTILATDAAGTNDPLTYSIDCDGDLQVDQGPQISNVFICPEGGALQTGLVWVLDDDNGMMTAPFEISNALDLCANRWNGSLSVMINECGRSDIELHLPSNESLIICANEWNGAARYAFDGDCNRTERTILYPDAAPVDICVNQWNGQLRIVDGPNQCSRSEYHRLM